MLPTFSIVVCERLLVGAASTVRDLWGMTPVHSQLLATVYIARISHVLQNGSNFFTSIEDKMHVPVLDKIIVADMNGKHIEKV